MQLAHRVIQKERHGHRYAAQGHHTRLGAPAGAVRQPEEDHAVPPHLHECYNDGTDGNPAHQEQQRREDHLTQHRPGRGERNPSREMRKMADGVIDKPEHQRPEQREDETQGEGQHEPLRRHEHRSLAREEPPRIGKELIDRPQTAGVDVHSMYIPDVTNFG